MPVVKSACNEAFSMPMKHTLNTVKGRGTTNVGGYNKHATADMVSGRSSSYKLHKLLENILAKFGIICIVLEYHVITQYCIEPSVVSIAHAPHHHFYSTK